MTVAAWLAGRSPRPPAELLARALDALGPDANAPEERLPESCLAAAKRTLESLIADQRFGRDSATDVLAVDALVTYAYEYAGTARSHAQVEALATQGAHMLGLLADHHA